MNGSGGLLLRNLKFLINLNATQQQQPPQTFVPPPSPEIADSTSNLNLDAQPFVVTPPFAPTSTRILRALKQIQNFNKPGLKE